MKRLYFFYGALIVLALCGGVLWYLVRPQEVALARGEVVFENSLIEAATTKNGLLLVDAQHALTVSSLTNPSTIRYTVPGIGHVSLNHQKTRALVSINEAEYWKEIDLSTGKLLDSIYMCMGRIAWQTETTFACQQPTNAESGEAFDESITTELVQYNLQLDSGPEIILADSSQWSLVGSYQEDTLLLRQLTGREADWHGTEAVQPTTIAWFDSTQKKFIRQTTHTIVGDSLRVYGGMIFANTSTSIPALYAIDSEQFRDVSLLASTNHVTPYKDGVVLLEEDSYGVLSFITFYKDGKSRKLAKIPSQILNPLALFSEGDELFIHDNNSGLWRVNVP